MASEDDFVATVLCCTPLLTSAQSLNGTERWKEGTDSTELSSDLYMAMACMCPCACVHTTVNTDGNRSKGHAGRGVAHSSADSFCCRHLPAAARPILSRQRGTNVRAFLVCVSTGADAKGQPQGPLT